MRVIQVLILLCSSLCALAQGPSQNGIGVNMETLRMLLTTTAVRAEVVHMPDAALTRVAVNPQALRSSASLRKTFGGNLLSTFDPTLSGVSVRPEEHAPDLRWGVLFFDSKDNEVASLFVDRFGRYGYLNGEKVSFDVGFLGTNLAKRLNKVTGIER